MKKLLGLIFLFILVGCDSYKGELIVSEQTIFSNGEERLIIAPGSHEMKIRFTSKRNATLTVDKSKIAVKLNEDFKMPTNGDFVIHNDQWNLNLTAQGHVSTTSQMGELRRDWESCSYQVPRQVCDNNGCRTVWVSVSGRQDVEYRIRTITELLNMTISDDQAITSNFSSRHQAYQKIYAYRGTCH